LCSNNNRPLSYTRAELCYDRGRLFEHNFARVNDRGRLFEHSIAREYDRGRLFEHSSALVYDRGRLLFEHKFA
jgi:hypothetical protein